MLTAVKTTSPVDLDQLFNTLDPPTRKALQDVIKGSATQYAGRGAVNNQAAKYFNPAISTAARLVNEADRDQQAFEDLIVYGAKVTTALAERRADLTNLVTNANTTAGAIGDENVALSQTLALLPDTLRKGNTTFVNLRATLDDLDKLTDASLPATKRLAPLFRALRPLVADARPTIRDLRRLVTEPGANNDLIDLLGKAPTLARVAKPAFAHTITALQKTTPVLDFIRPYTPDFVGWLRDFGQGAVELRRQRPLRAHPADLQRLLVHVEPGRRHAARDPRQPAPGGAGHGQPRALPWRRQPVPGRQLRAVPRQQRHARLRPEPGALRAMRRLLVLAVVLACAAALAVVGTGAAATAAATRCARSSRTRSR